MKRSGMLAVLGAAALVLAGCSGGDDGASKGVFSGAKQAEDKARAAGQQVLDAARKQEKAANQQ